MAKVVAFSDLTKDVILRGALFPERVRVVATAPVAGACQVIAVGLNYGDHARESGLELPKEPLFWFKAPTSLIPDGAKIEIPFAAHRVDYEAELAIVIGRRVRNVTPAAAARYIFGYTAAQDVSDRTIQHSESQWARAKSFDTFCPVGPVVATVVDPLEVFVSCRVNGAQRQRGSTRDMTVDPFTLVSYIAHVMTLLPGDVVSTGTPEGVGPIRHGDWVEVEVDGIGVLRNPVV